jgi:4'-phosphopantetheinyl transferase EntD
MSLQIPLESVLPSQNAARGSDLLTSLFGASVVACELRGEGDVSTLLPEEAGSCQPFRAKRLTEFAAGRSCARLALDALGFPQFALSANPDRTPRWPEGVVGSITHTVGFCGVVADFRTNVAALGVDVEIVARVGRELWPQVFTAAEHAASAALDETQRERFAALVFSAKEAFYKSQFGLTGRWLDFHDVIVENRPEDSRSGSLVVRAASTRAGSLLRELAAAGRYRFEGGFVATGIALGAEDAAILTRPSSAGGV